MLFCPQFNICAFSSFAVGHEPATAGVDPASAKLLARVRKTFGKLEAMTTGFLLERNRFNRFDILALIGGC
jgi:hypothetical protein